MRGEKSGSGRKQTISFSFGCASPESSVAFASADLSAIVLTGPFSGCVGAYWGVYWLNGLIW